jgi:hypothetical protein
MRELLNSKIGQIIFSIILGLGLATLFRKACKDNKCVVIQGPLPESIINDYYKVNGSCVKYEPVFVECDR